MAILSILFFFFCRPFAGSIWWSYRETPIKARTSCNFWVIIELYIQCFMQKLTTGYAKNSQLMLIGMSSVR